MRAYFFNMSNEEKSNILDQHKSMYDGYQTMQPNVKNPMDLYVQDFANDKGGVMINNKGEVKKYSNLAINEDVDIGLLTDDPGMDENLEEEKQMCSECGTGYMEEGICNECGYKMEGINDVEDLNPKDEFDYVGGADNATDTFHEQDDLDSDLGVGMDDEVFESVKNEKNKIMEMFVRMNVIK
jgi:hypothetical protein